MNDCDVNGYDCEPFCLFNRPIVIHKDANKLVYF